MRTAPLRPSRQRVIMNDRGVRHWRIPREHFGGIADALDAGGRLRGPAVIEEHESTVVLGRDAAIEVDRYCNLHVKLASAKSKVRRSR